MTPREQDQDAARERDHRDVALAESAYAEDDARHRRGDAVTDEQRVVFFAERTRNFARWDVQDAAESIRAATANLRTAVRAAHAARVPIAHIAADAGVTRQTVYRWIRDDTP